MKQDVPVDGIPSYAYQFLGFAMNLRALAGLARSADPRTKFAPALDLLADHADSIAAPHLADAAARIEARQAGAGVKLAA
jgi:hypothetical protein